jgi:hypothetical protein
MTQDTLPVRVLRAIEELLKDRPPNDRYVDTNMVLQRMRLGSEAMDEVAQTMSDLWEDGYVRGPKPLTGDSKVLDVTVTTITDTGSKLLSA